MNQPLNGKVTAASPARPAEDVSGRSRMVWNVLTGWGAYLVYIVAGFVLPRCIDDHLGQLALGVWDFGWTIVSYFALAQVGIGSSVHRYIAAQRTTGDVDGLRATASTMTAILIGVAILVIVLAGLAAAVLPWLAGERIAPALLSDARWVIVLFGLNLGVQQVTDIFNSVLTGCHRWDLHNAINSGCYILTVIASVAVLLLGGGLRELALVTLLGTMLTQALRGVAAFKVCPELRLSARYVRRADAKSLVTFGGKTFVPRIADLLMEQTISFLICIFLGLGALAVFSRPRGLLRHGASLVGRLAFVLEPMAGSLQASDSRDELRGILTRTTGAGALIALPITVLMLILGDPILTVWMGEDYRVGWVMPVLALGSLFSIAQLPVHSLLIGMNAHGRVGIAKLIASIVAVGLAYVLMAGIQLGLLGAALAVAVPMFAIGGVYVPLRACRLLELDPARYFVMAWMRPILCQLPFALILLCARLSAPHWTLPLLATVVAIASAALCATYWSMALPASMKDRIARRLKLRARVAIASTAK
jgi:O-antigen/teichoic acid export membrane protein